MQHARVWGCQVTHASRIIFQDDLLRLLQPQETLRGRTLTPRPSLPAWACPVLSCGYPRLPSLCLAQNKELHWRLLSELLLLFSRSVIFNSLRPHGLQHASTWVPGTEMEFHSFPNMQGASSVSHTTQRQSTRNAAPALSKLTVWRGVTV